MLENLQILLPIFSIMFAGFLLGRTSVFPEGSGAANSLSTYVWHIAIPALLVKLIADNNLPDASEFVWIGSYYFCLYVIYFFAYLFVAPLIGIKARGKAVFSFCVCFGNLGFIGIPVVQSVYGDAGLRSLLLIMSFHSMTLIFVSSVLAELNNSGGKRGFAMILEILVRLVKNPIIITLVASLLWSATGLGISDWVISIISLPANSAAPVGLFAVGLSLSRVKLKGVRVVAISAVTIKLLLLPLFIYWFFGSVMQFSSQQVAIATIAACLPTGVVAYNFAQQYEVRVQSAAATILLASILSALTLTLALSYLN